MDTFSATIKTKEVRQKAKVMQEAGQHLDVRVVDYQEISKGFFSTKYIAYRVRTEQMNWEVQRRFNDFNWLRTTLVKEFPGSYIPPVAKRTTKRRYEKYFLNKRQAIFQKFLDAVLAKEELRNS